MARKLKHAFWANQLVHTLLSNLNPKTPYKRNSPAPEKIPARRLPFDDTVGILEHCSFACSCTSHTTYTIVATPLFVWNSYLKVPT